MKRQEQGFSLPELLIVVAIISILAALGVPGFLKSRQAAREAATIQTMRTVVSAQNTYICTTGNYQSYGDGTQLVSSGLLDGLLLTSPKNHYRFTLALGNLATTFTVNADPVDADATARHFFSSNIGSIHYRIGATAGPADPLIP